MSKKNIHVVPYKDRWATRKDGSSRVSGVFSRKQDAIDSGRDNARRNRVELVIHKKDGKIQDKDSYGNDPFPPRDKKL